MRVIKPKKFNPDIFTKQFTSAMDVTVQVFSDSYRQSYKNWKHKPYFQSKVYSVGNEIIGRTWTSGKASKDNPYPFIERGTKVRRVLLSSDWVSKTTPGRLVSRQGRGKVVFISKEINRPGIKKRNFTGLIKKAQSKQYPRRMIRAMEVAAKKSKYYIKV